jgi:hypothetical protein
MDEVRFEFVFRHLGWKSGEIVITVNGTTFAEIARAHELPFAQAEGHASIAGNYHGLEPDGVVPPSRHFLGEPTSSIYRYGDRIQILGCACGEPGCWPLVCRIETTEELVSWFDFEQPQRSGRSGPHPRWRYEGFGPFEFSRKQYESALAELAQRPAS